MIVVVGLVCVLVLFELLAEGALKHWASLGQGTRNPKQQWKEGFLVGGVFAYVAVALVLAYTLRAVSDKTLVVINTLWQAVNIVGVAVVGVVLFKETLTARQWVGVCAAFLASVLLLL